MGERGDQGIIEEAKVSGGFRDGTSAPGTDALMPSGPGTKPKPKPRPKPKTPAWITAASKKNIAENIWASLIATVLAASVTGVLAYNLFEKIRIRVAQGQLELNREIAANEVDLGRKTAANELRLKLIDRSEEAAELFASSIPRQLALQRRFWELAEESYAVRHKLPEADRLNTSAYRRRSERDDLLAEWRSQVSYIAAGELVGGRAPEARDYAVSITSCIDLLTQLDPHDLHHDPEQFLGDYIAALRAVPETSRAAHMVRGVFAAHTQKLLEEPERQPHWQRKQAFWEQISGTEPSEASGSIGFGSAAVGDEVERWQQRAIEELRIASDWLEAYNRWSHADEDGGRADTPGSISEGYSVERAKLESLRACRRSIEYTVDMLYTEAMRAIGQSIKRKVDEILDNATSDSSEAGDA